MQREREGYAQAKLFGDSNRFTCSAQTPLEGLRGHENQDKILYFLLLKIFSLFFLH